MLSNCSPLRERRRHQAEVHPRFADQSQLPQSSPQSQHEDAPLTFDIFVHSADVRWCLLLHCDYASLAVMRQVCAAFVLDIPIVLNSMEWCAKPASAAALHAAQWTAGGEAVLHQALSTPVGQTVVQLHCRDDASRKTALAHGGQLDESGNPVMVLNHPIGIELTLSAAQIAAVAPPMAPFLRSPLACTTTIVAGATHRLGAVQRVSAAPNAIVANDSDAAVPARGLRAYRSQHLVASGGLDGFSRVWSVAPPPLSAPSTALSDLAVLRVAPLSIQGGLRHGGALSVVDVRPSGALLTACTTSTTLRVHELEAAQLAAARIAAAGMTVPSTVSNSGHSSSGRPEWNYVERRRLEHPHAQHSVVAAAWLDETTLVEAGFSSVAVGGDADGAAQGTQRVLRTWRIEDGPQRPATVTCVDSGFSMAANFSALAASNGLLLVTHNPADGGPGYADVWCAMVRAMDANAPPELVPVRRLQEHTGPLYACALDGRMLATGGDDGTVRLWCGASLLLPDDCAGQPQPMASLQTLHLPGKVWALALHSHILVAGGALDYDRFDYDQTRLDRFGRSQGRDAGQICVTLFGVADLATRRGPAVTLRTLQAPSIAHDWGVRSVATYGGTVVVAGGDDGVVHVWTLAQKGKLDRPDVHFEV